MGLTGVFGIGVRMGQHNQGHITIHNRVGMDTGSGKELHYNVDTYEERKTCNNACSTFLIFRSTHLPRLVEISTGIYPPSHHQNNPTTPTNLHVPTNTTTTHLYFPSTLLPHKPLHPPAIQHLPILPPPIKPPRQKHIHRPRIHHNKPHRLQHEPHIDLAPHALQPPTRRYPLTTAFGTLAGFLFPGRRD